MKLVLLLDSFKDKLEELKVFLIVTYLKTKEPCCLIESIDTYSAVQLAYVDISTIACCKHTFLLSLIEHCLECNMILVHSFKNGSKVLLESRFPVLTFKRSCSAIFHAVQESFFLPIPILDYSVHIKSDNITATSHNTCQTRSRTESILSEFILQPATRGKGVSTVRDIGKETMSLCIHLCCKLLIFLVNDVMPIMNHSHSLNRECKHLLQP